MAEDRGPTMVHVGCRIRDERLRRGWSLAEYAARVGVKPSTVGSWERAERVMGVGDLVRAARAFGVTPLSLLPGYGDLPWPGTPGLTDDQVAQHAERLIRAGIRSGGR